MPRGVKGTVDYGKEIEKIDERIGKLTDQIKDLQTRRNEFLSLKRDADLKGLYEVMNKKGLTAEAVVALIEKANKQA